MANLRDHSPFSSRSQHYSHGTLTRSPDEGTNEASPQVSEARRRGAVDIVDTDAGGEGGGGGGGGGTGGHISAVGEGGVQAGV